MVERERDTEAARTLGEHLHEIPPQKVCGVYYINTSLALDHRPNVPTRKRSVSHKLDGNGGTEDQLFCASNPVRSLRRRIATPKFLKDRDVHMLVDSHFPFAHVNCVFFLVNCVCVRVSVCLCRCVHERELVCREGWHFFEVLIVVLRLLLLLLALECSLKLHVPNDRQLAQGTSLLPLCTYNMRI